MRKGAEMAAKAVGCELLFQGAPDFNPVTQVPVLQAVIARKPECHPDRAHRQAAADRTPAAGDRRRHPGDQRRHVHRRRQVPGRLGAGRFPALLHRHRQRAGRLPRRLGAGQAGRRQGQGLRLQRQARHQHHRPARGGLQGGDEELPRHHRAGDPVQRRRRQQGGRSGPGGVRAQPRPRRHLRRQPVLGDRCRRRRQGAGQVGRDPGGRLRCADADRRRPQVRPDRPRRRPAPGRDRLLRRHDRLCRDPRPVGAAAHRHRRHDHDQGQYRRSGRDEVRLQRLMPPSGRACQPRLAHLSRSMPE